MATKKRVKKAAPKTVRKAAPKPEPQAEPEDTVDPINTVAFVGTGNMGTPMAANLSGSLEHLCLYDTRIETAVSAAEAANCHVAASFEEAATNAECLILMLPNGNIVRNVLFNDPSQPDIPSAGLKPGMIVVDMSSSYPPTTQKTGAALLEHEIILCDAPVSGGVKRAKNASLTIMLGGNFEEVLKRVTKLLGAMGKVTPTGALGTAHAMKALNNYLSAVGLSAASEAVLIGREFGLAPATMIDIINSSTGRNNATQIKFHQQIFNKAFGSGFHLDLMTKDVKAASSMAEELGLNAPGLTREAELWADASAATERDADHTEIYKYLEELIGATPSDDEEA
ncbi:MAG: NAD(P)-dependent oxidoreductase [Alphaproteobacteria bacterium]|nr:NAD(P)-dependent oxidoreductase [Alphaproteobacteria bacterium]